MSMSYDPFGQMTTTKEPCPTEEVRLIGCCGAYCATCTAFTTGFCKGCKLGYADGNRELVKAKCKMKVCCLATKKFETCADCPEYGCIILTEFWGKKGYKYGKYKESLEFIHINGYGKFIERAKSWKGAFGKL